ncbi:MAG: HAD family hydrolase [Lysobacter sp.]|nr:HAD family hydrolase [Lysobacter sp.]
MSTSVPASATLAHLAGIDDALLARAAKIRLVCFDVDGTLTDGRLIYGGREENDSGEANANTREFKAFHVHDGQGLTLLRKAGFEVALITARNSAAAEQRARDLGVRAHIGSSDKLAQVDALCTELGIAREHVAFMGDDVPDLTAMRAVGLAVAPANAHAWTAAEAHWRTRARAGKGAARELCDLILVAQGLLPDALAARGDARIDVVSDRA